MSVTTPALGTQAVEGQQQQWYRFVRRLAVRPASELSLVYVPEGTHDRLAVLKRLPPGLATDPAAVEKFRIEARIAAMLEHPSIVRVFEIVESSREDFYTMEYVRGADMRQLMDALAAQRRTLPLDCVLLIAIELCTALDYAHHLTDANGLPAPIVHRELSPSKVLLGIDGTIKLTGFAAPPLVQAKPRRSRTESVGYTSPERCLGETTDSRSDVFALGVLLYELSSGERLFAEATTEHQIMMKLVRGDLPRPSEIRRGYPRELETILMRALARDRKDRYQSASELQVDLETFLWSRWPTASTAALAKLVGTAFPSDEAADLASGSRELERIDPFTAGPFAAGAAPPSDDPVMWLGPVPLAKPYVRAGEGGPPRTDTKELRRLAPETFPDASNTGVTLGAPGPKPSADDLKRPSTTMERAQTIDELAIPVEHPASDNVHVDLDDVAAAASGVPRRNANVLPPTGPIRRAQQITAGQKTVVRKTDVVLGTPGAKPSPLGAEASARARAFAAASTQVQNDQHTPVVVPRGQYQRPEALDEHVPPGPDELIIERLRTKKRDGERASNANLSRTRTAEVAPSAYANIDLEDRATTVQRRDTDPKLPRARTDVNIARVELARVPTPAGLVRADVVRTPAFRAPSSPPVAPPEPPAAPAVAAAPPTPTPVAATQAELDLDQASHVSWTLIPSPPAPDPVDAIKQRLPSPPPGALVTRRWPLGTIAAIVGVVIVGVMASAWAIRRTVHEPSNLPEVITASPSPPTELVVHTRQKVADAAPAPTGDVKKKPKGAPAARTAPPRPGAHDSGDAPAHPADVAAGEPTAKKIPPLFPPQEMPAGPGSLDGLPSIQTFEVKGTTHDIAIRNAVEQTLSPLRGCYRAAARAKHQTPQVALTIAFEIDQRRVPVKIRAVGGGVLDALATCAAKVTADIRDLPAPPSGATARVSVSLEFRPNP